ncbi:MAG: hypothetical protein H6657_14995 [Ardenticatenaceae bacterium]|nr:hypothetical protein [Ardenticatenaceae bacterium]
MSLLSVSLFGRFQTWSNNKQVLLDIEGRKEQELLCYLLTYRNRPHSREVLANLLWHDSSSTRSKSYLRKALWQLQNALESLVKSLSSPLLLVESDWIQLNTSTELWLDVEEFEKAFNLVQGISGATLDPMQVQALKNALDLYQGELLENWYQNWCLYEREKFKHLYLTMQDKLLDHYEARHDYEAGLVHGLRILQHDQARERTHRRLMRLLYLKGDRTAALRQYERCVSALEEELGVKPSQRTISLCERIKQGKSETPVQPPTQTDPMLPLANILLSEVLVHLKELHLVMFNFQDQVQKKIELIEQTIPPS